MAQMKKLARLPAALKRRAHELSRKIAFQLVKPRNTFATKDALILCADPRGGSTWLYEMLLRIEGVAGLWEPLDIGRVRIFRDLGFSYRQYLPEDAREPQARAAFEKLFAGQCREPYILHRTTVKDFLHAERLLVKFCRATQLLPWLEREFKFVRKPVHLVRHPCAVVASQMKYGAWNQVAPGFNESAVLADALLRPHADILLKIDTVEARLAAFWAMTNRIAIQHPERERRWVTISYENLVADPVAALSVILDEWGCSIDRLEQVVARPSRTTLDASPIASGDQQKQLTYWQKTLTVRQIDLILETTNALGLPIYDDTAAPPKLTPAV